MTICENSFILTLAVTPDTILPPLSRRAVQGRRDASYSLTRLQVFARPAQTSAQPLCGRVFSIPLYGLAHDESLWGCATTH
jgi:hypothetical protein